jgi:hypothetical protein
VGLVAALPSLPLAAATDTTPATKGAPLQAAVRAAAVAAVPAVGKAGANAAPRAEQSGPSKQSTGFFHSRPGAIALAVMAGGAGYALYSASHDRINSPAKKK